MANKYYEPKAAPVAQIATVQVTAFDATTTYILKVNGVTIVSTLGNADASTTASDISTAWNASTHIYATGITASVSTDTVTLTADIAEPRFTVVSSVSGGAGTIGSVTITTTATGPHTLSDPINWNGEALPVNGDVLYFRDSDVDIAWDLGGLTTTGHTVHFEASYTGNIGLNRAGFATSADGQTVDTTAQEYRPAYLQLDMSRVEVGGHDGINDPGGARRLMIDNDRSGASTLVVHRTSATGEETGKPPVRYLANHADADVDIRDGRVGIGVDEPGETTTVGDVTVHEGGVVIGDGVTLTNITHHSGVSRAHLGAATATQILVHGGQLETRGDQAITTLKVTGGEVISNTTGTITTCTHEGGRVDYSQSGEARTVTTHQLFRGAELVTNKDVVTITNFEEPDGPSTISVAA